MPCIPVRLVIRDGTHWSGPSSVAEVSHMQIQRQMNEGRSRSISMARLLTPALTLSVTGKLCPLIMNRYATATSGMVSSLTRQPRVAVASLTEPSRPMILVIT